MEEEKQTRNDGMGEPVWPSGKAVDGKQKGLGSNPLRLSLLFEKVVVYGRCLVTVSLIM